MILSNETLGYIKSFLGIGDNVTYCHISDISANAKIVIVASGFFDEGVFGTSESLPCLPLQEWRNIPVLFGAPKEEYVDGRIIIHADIIASAFFLLSRYEETVRKDGRDQYGRFCGRASLPYRAGFIDRPIVDEYRSALRCVLGLPPEEEGFSKIWLTHDIDIPWEHFTVFTAIKRILGNFKRHQGVDLYPLKSALGYPESDPHYTFLTMLKIDDTLKNVAGVICQTVYFALSGGHAKPQDAPVYIHTKAFRRLVNILRNSGALIGYHASYEAGDNPEIIGTEINAFTKVLGAHPTLCRNHYLNSKRIEDFHTLIKAGITDDFTMSYADLAGFRLGTSRSVKWIDPINGKLTSLTLHPLTLMECTLFNNNYMNLEYGDAQQYADRLISHAFQHNGELTLLWHNECFHDNSNELKLYLHIIQRLIKGWNRSANDVKSIHS